jgi:hypothetical protein
MALKDTVLHWLLEPQSPGARYLTMRDLLDYPPDDHDFIVARAEAHTKGEIAALLAAMDGTGYWVKPGPGYSPKYKSTVWTVILLSQLGASASQDERIEVACHHLLDHSLLDDGQFTTSGTPSSNVDCLQGNLCAAMLDLGVDDPRLDKAFEWMARSITGEGIAPATEQQDGVRYYSANCGPQFACGYNGRKPCAWGAVKAMLAFSKLAEDRRTPLMRRAIVDGVEFLFSTDPALADYPTKDDAKPSRHWWKFGFPVFYVTDLLQNVEALVALGYGSDPRLNNALDKIREKQNAEGRWGLDHTYKTWVDFGAEKQPNKWVTLRALRVLKALDEA